MRKFLAVCACLLGLEVHAALPEVATIDRSAWPEQLASEDLFDVASRAHILGFAHELYLSEGLDEEGLKKRLGLRYVNLQSLNLIRNRLWNRLLENYQSAQKSCPQDASFCVLVEDMNMLRQRAAEFKIADDSFYAMWAAPSSAFHERYLNELLYQAALFPQISSEIARYNSDELSGDAMADRTFQLNFEGGPTGADGGTDWLADFMRQQKMNATFFVLGKNLQERLEAGSATALQSLYRLQCVGVQGWEYRSHGQWLEWQDSVLRSAALTQLLLPDHYIPLFRPPYGHRRADSGQFFRDQNLRVSLWTIDAQDANGRLSAEQISDRIISLMLLWRRGTVVFHDASARVQSAVPLLLASTARSQLTWGDCHNIPESPAE